LRKLIPPLAVAIVFTLIAISTHNAFLLNDYRNVSSAEKIEILIERGDTGVKIAQKLKDSGVIKAEKVKDVEGFLFPAQYSIVPGTTFDQAVDQMIQRFYISAKQSGIENGYRGYSPFELLIIASMIESEGDLVDFPKIARVIYNRLEIGMPLQINATIDYATNTLNPANGDWLYYVTVKPGDTRFTRSFDEFNVWANEFRKNEDAGLFG